MSRQTCPWLYDTDSPFPICSIERLPLIEMTPTSPPSSSSTVSSARPPTRNKSSSSLSTHTLRSLSSTSTGTGKPRRNKSAVSLHHGHGAGHHNVQFTAHHPTRKGSHGASGSTAMKRRGSSQSSSQGPTGAGGGGSGFGLGMTSMTRSDSHGSNGDHAVEDEVEPVKVRPDLGARRTSSSSSTTTVVGGGRSRSRGTAKRQNSGDVRGRGKTSEGDSRSRSRANSRNQREEEEPTNDRKDEASSVTSTGEWASETDSPLNIGKKLPDVEVQKDFKPEGTSGLSMQLEVDQQQNGSKQPPSRNTTPSRLRKSKFQFAEDEDDDDEAEEEEQATPRSPPPEIPAAAMPPAETPALPALPAMLQQITPVRSPEPDETRAPPSPPPEQVGESAALQAPAAPSAPQGISPPDQKEFGQLPPVAGPELSRSPSPMTGGSLRREDSSRPEMEEPSLAQAANVDEPNMAVSEDKRHQQKHQGLKSLPRPSPRGHESPSHSNKVTPEEGRSPAGPNPTELQEQAKEGPSKDVEPQPSHPASNQLDRPVRRHPTRKSSNASVLSMASARSAAPSLISRMAPPAHFRRSASGIAPMVSRDSLIRGEMATPSPEPIAEDQPLRPDATKSRKNGGRSATFSHERTSSQNSNRSVRSPSVTEPPSRRSNTYAAGEVRKPRISDGSNSGGGALAALGQIHQAAIVRTPSIASPGEGGGGGPRTPGALTHAKRSASGYFSSALRGLTSLPSALTPPLSPSAGSSSYTGIGGSSGGGGKHPIPGSSGMQTGGTALGSSYSRSGGRSRSSPSPQQPPLIVKFLEQPSLPLAPPPSDSNPSTSPRQQNRPQSLSQAHRNASSASLAMSRTQQKALLARDAPYYPTSSPSSSGPSTSTQGLPPSNGLAPPPSPAPSSQSHPYLPSSSQPSSNASANSSGMQRWAFGLIKEAERIERQWRCIEKWRDPVGESLERVLFRSSRAMERGGGSAGGSGSASGRDSGNEALSSTGTGKLVRIQKGRCKSHFVSFNG